MAKDIEFTEKEHDYLKRLKLLTVGKHPKCNYSGRLVDGEDCDCLIMFGWLMNLYLSRIPKEYWALEYSLKPKQELDNYFEDDESFYDGLGYYIQGGFGVGKTTTLAEIGKRFLLQDKQVVYFMLKEFMDAVYYQMNNREGNEDLECLFERIQTADVLLIDEFDKTYVKQGSDFVLREVESFLRTKLTNNYPTFIASNVGIDKIGEIFGNESIQVAIKRKLEPLGLSKKINTKNRPSLKDIVRFESVREAAELYQKVYKQRFHQGTRKEWTKKKS